MTDGVEVPSRGRILTTLAATAIFAAAILVLIVLPAEYQIDPTGFGRLVGLDRLYTSPSAESLPVLADGLAGTDSEPYRSEEVTIGLAPEEAIEFKIAMREGSNVVFSWAIDRGTVYSDFHAEPFNDLDDEDTRYKEEADVGSGNGSLRAPFAGLHGWYWENGNAFPVEITLQVSGFYLELRELWRGPSAGLGRGSMN